MNQPLVKAPGLIGLVNVDFWLKRQFYSTPNYKPLKWLYMSEQKKILFVCVENSNRSQFSQEFARIHGGEAMKEYSACSKPSAIVNPKAIAAIKELDYDLSKHDSKALDEVKQYAPFDAVITMSCGDACPWMPAKKFINWEIPDPKNMEPKQFNEIRVFYSKKVQALVRELDSAQMSTRIDFKIYYHL